VKPRPVRQARSKAFGAVMKVGLTLPDVEAATKYDGTPVLKVRGCEDAPETYYLTDYYRPYPLVLARRLALAKAGPAHGDLKAGVLARRKAFSEASRSAGNVSAVASRRMRGVSQ
jgi:hypothetical protein